MTDVERNEFTRGWDSGVEYARREGLRAKRLGPLPEIPMYYGLYLKYAPGSSRYVTAEEGAKLPGIQISGTFATGAPVDTSERAGVLATVVAEAKALRPDLRTYVHVRPDVYTEVREFPLFPGFDDDWIPRIRQDQLFADLTRFTSAGWDIDYKSWVSKAFINRIPTGGSPHYYGTIGHGTNTYRIGHVMPDMRLPEYRAWQIEWLRALVETTHADGISFGVKTGWHAHPMELGPASPSKRWGDPLSMTFYGPGEYESAVTAWVREVKAALGLPIVIRDSAVAPGREPGFWYPPELEVELQGSYLPLPVPSAEFIAGLR